MDEEKQELLKEKMVANSSKKAGPLRIRWLLIQAKTKKVNLRKFVLMY